MADCIFCKIASGEIPNVKIVYEDEATMAFLDLNPQAPVHALVIPRRHIDRLTAAEDGDTELLGKLQLTAAKTAKLLKVEGAFRLVTNNGKGAGQSVDHLHYHLLGGRKMLWPPG
ncbi:MAG: histidine triad nucleotide-binding protein [Elusimicrobia bacterium GWC2_64_44]|nr:MAG: histidine triad nucleotide-binding protein [Elusimicrobia bacterium GWC2_64_44]